MDASMTEISLNILGGGRLQVYGDLSARRVLLILSRDQFWLDDDLVTRLADALVRPDVVVLRHESRLAGTLRLIDPPGNHRLPPRLRLVLRGLRLLRHPDRWDHFLRHRRDRENDVAYRARALGELVQWLGPGREIAVLARSAGARVATLVADQLGLSRVVCLGYPFRSPTEGPDPARYAHLASLRTPTLILQGIRDEYGGRETAGAYALARRTRLEWIDCGHEFAVANAEWERVRRLLLDFLDSPADHSGISGSASCAGRTSDSCQPR